MQQSNLSVNDLLLLIGELYAERRSLQQQVVNLTAALQRLQRQLDEAQRGDGSTGDEAGAEADEGRK